MSKEERKPYDDRACLARDAYKQVKYTTDGLEIDKVERQAKEAEEKMRNMKNEITRHLKTCAFAELLADEVFLIVHVNHLIYYPAEDEYLLCEIAICAFNLKNGIENVFHRIIKPGKLPLGFYGGALTHSKETHQLLEIVQEEPFENNTEEVFSDIICFMKRFAAIDCKLPILYADEKTFEMTTKVFDNFCEKFHFADEIKVYNLQYMFFALRNTAAGQNVWPTETFSYTEIEKDVYSYCPNISCEFHEVSDISVYCSKSIVTRYAYIICDNCCSDMCIQMKPGRHVPENSKIRNMFTSKSESVCSIDNLSIARRDSFSSQGYGENYPPLGDSRATTPSIVSFSSMRTPRGRNEASTSKNAAEEDSHHADGFSESKRFYKNLKFPEHGYKKRDD
ncbi:Maelstrom domain containing protein [Asbolus verrucosus]|uniref:Maelstrom domain containing protein n=1 Tax=Asbolus verrucosus TaxID=1661398 RepID=A0A482V7G7_ASBVE|nr:Maelstrom domain containing protein [Asbolus verrucosus]